jgi:excinuclease ABC subunit A
MHFLPDVYVPCDVCQGKRYNRETLEIRYRGKNIHEILQMNIEEANGFFAPVPRTRTSRSACASPATRARTTPAT